MPLYQYECESCKKVTEKLEPITSKRKEVKCSNCGGKSKRIMSAGTFRIVGDGYSPQ